MLNPKTAILAIILALISLIFLSGCANQPADPDKNIYLCQVDSDCVPKPECHPLECINQKYAAETEKPRVCTAVFISEAAYKKEDCACQVGVCINKNRQPVVESSDEQSGMEYSRQFVLDSSTYKYDGSDIRYAGMKTLGCQGCISFTFTFTSNRAGYGDRTGQFVAEVDTPHQAVITVENGRITGGIIDGKWDMLKDEMIPGAEHPEIPEDEYCEQDEECACGIHRDTKDCFYGNIEYVNEGVQCPDFCTGIAGNLAVRCIGNRCQQIILE